MKTKANYALLGILLAAAVNGAAQPIITNQPQNQTNLAGTTAAFTIGATGAEPLSYQWRSYFADGITYTTIPSGTEATLVLTNVQPTTRLFAVVVTDSGGLSATSSPLATLTVLTPPSITIQPAVQIMTVGATATFTVTATGTAPLAYQWRINDANLAEKTNRNLVLTNVQLTNASDYTVVVTNAFGAVTSRVAGLMFTSPHRFGGIAANPDHSISLNLAGVVPKLFASFYDIYIVEASTNLVVWSSLAMLQRTNNSADALNYLDLDAAHLANRFYRTPTNHFLTFLPKPNGPYPVGTLSRLLTDPSRINAIRHTNHQFMISFWYPAIVQGGKLPAPYVERPLAQYSYWYGQYTGIVPSFVSHSFSNAAVAASPTRFPIVLYSPGGDGHRRENTDKAEELASRGYIVVGIDAPETPLSVFPDGTLVTGEPGQSSYQGNVSQIQARVLDERFTLDELTRLDATDPMFAGRLDLDRVGAFGFSRGGATSAQLCYNDTRCKAGINMDGWFLVSNAVQTPLPKPFLILRTDTPDVTMPDGRPDDLRPTFDTMTTNGYYMIVAQSDHWNFDYYFFRNQTPTFRRVHQIWNSYILSFFNKHLLNQDDHLLDCPSPYPEVIECLRK